MLEHRMDGEENDMGVWIFKEKARHNDWSLFKCSECGMIINATVRDFYLHLFDFCPRCGAKMGGHTNDSNT